MFCKECGTLIDDEATACGICGAKVKKDDTIKIEVNNTINAGKTKNKWATIILAFFLGGLGAHKLYEGKYFMFIVYLLLSWSGVSAFFAIIDIIIALFKPTYYTV